MKNEFNKEFSKPDIAVLLIAIIVVLGGGSYYYTTLHPSAPSTAPITLIVDRHPSYRASTRDSITNMLDGR